MGSLFSLVRIGLTKGFKRFSNFFKRKPSKTSKSKSQVYIQAIYYDFIFYNTSSFTSEFIQIYMYGISSSKLVVQSKN